MGIGGEMGRTGRVAVLGQRVPIRTEMGSAFALTTDVWFDHFASPFLRVRTEDARKRKGRGFVGPNENYFGSDFTKDPDPAVSKARNRQIPRRCRLPYLKDSFPEAARGPGQTGARQGEDR